MISPLFGIQLLGKLFQPWNIPDSDDIYLAPDCLSQLFHTVETHRGYLCLSLINFFESFICKQIRTTQLISICGPLLGANVAFLTPGCIAEYSGLGGCSKTSSHSELINKHSVKVINPFYSRLFIADRKSLYKCVTITPYNNAVINHL